MVTTSSGLATHPQPARSQQSGTQTRALLMRQDIRAARRCGVPVVGRGGACSRSRPTRTGSNDHQPQVGVTRRGRCPTYNGFRPGRREMLRDTLRAVPGGVADRDPHPAADERGAGDGAQGHPGSPGRPSESAGDRRADAPSPTPQSSASQQPPEETQFSGLALRRGLRLNEGGGREGREAEQRSPVFVRRGGSSPERDANTKGMISIPRMSPDGAREREREREGGGAVESRGRIFSEEERPRRSFLTSSMYAESPRESRFLPPHDDVAVLDVGWVILGRATHFRAALNNDVGKLSTIPDEQTDLDPRSSSGVETRRVRDILCIFCTYASAYRYESTQ